MSSFYNLTANTIKGAPLDFKTLVGKPVLIVNVASKCGFTSQYKQLEELNQTYKDRGLVILGFPCNQFMGQESGTSSDIESFCQLNFGMMEKVEVNGKNESPVFTFLKTQISTPWYSKMIFGDNVFAHLLLINSSKWNFEKFLVDKSGKVVDRYSSTTDPATLKGPIEKLL